MADAQKQANRTGRKRILNIIYFIDSARTRSFRIPLERLHVMLSMIFLLVVWSIASVFIVYGMVQERQELVSRLSDSMNKLFEYESRYDGVYEIAYPSKNGQPTTAVSAEELAEATQSEPKAVAVEQPKTEGKVETPPVDYSGDLNEESEQPQEIAQEKTAAKPAEPQTKQTSQAEPKTEVTVESESKAAPASKPATDKSLVSVENPSVEPRDQGLVLKFKIQNSTSPDRAEGYIWSAASFVAEDGQKTWLPAPAPIAVQEDGNPLYPTKAYRYSIRYYKTEELSFKAPGGMAGKFTTIRIGLTDSMGKPIETYNIPVDVSIQGVAPGTSGAPQGSESGQQQSPGSRSNSVAPANSETSGSTSKPDEAMINELAAKKGNDP